jgi:F-type H+-transporting ATPase subunit epsilon
MATLHLEIVTPEARVYSDEVASVVLPGVEGELGVLPNHIPLMTMIKPGELRVVKGRENLSLATGEGFVEVMGDRVTVLTDMALREEEIDVEGVEAALKRAEEELKRKKPGVEDAEVVLLMVQIQKSVAQLNLKRRKKS